MSNSVANTGNGTMGDRLVLVEWRDAYGVGANWEPLKDVKAPSLTCYSAGWLVYDAEDCVVVVPHLSEQGHDKAERQGCGDMAIPRSAIISIKELSPHD